MIRWNPIVKNKAISLRKKGKSFGQISRELKISKSTLHAWVSHIKRPAKLVAFDKLRWAKKIQPMGALANKKKRDDIVDKIILEANKEMVQVKLDRTRMKTMLAMLYWAEGTKVRGVLQFANTDPRLICLFVFLLRRCYKLDENKFRLRLHLHDYHQEDRVKDYWSKLLNINKSKFEKTYWKKENKEKNYRRNIGGTCFVKYNSVYLKEQIVQYAYAIGTKITGSISASIA